MESPDDLVGAAMPQRQNETTKLLACPVAMAERKDHCLRLLLIGLQFATFASGMLVGLPLWWTVRIFSQTCPLFSVMRLDDAMNNTLTLETGKVSSSSETSCLYCTFLPMCASIYTVIWLWFYLLTNDWGRKKVVSGTPPKDAWMMVPSLVVNILLLVTSFPVLIILTEGVSDWCRNITDHLERPCRTVGEKKWANIPDGELSYGYLWAAVVGSWLLFLTLAGQTVVTSVRMYYYYKDLDLEAYDDSGDDLESSEVNENYDQKDRDTADPAVFKNQHLNADGIVIEVADIQLHEPPKIPDTPEPTS